MTQNDQNSVITTASGICGGLGKAISSNVVLADITLGGIVEVAVYAAISAVVGYGVKVLIDRIKKLFQK